MNHATSVTLRSLGLCSRSTCTSWPQSSQFLRRAFHSVNKQVAPTSHSSKRALPAFDIQRWKCTIRNHFGGKTAESSSRCSFSTTTRRNRLKPYPDEGEEGLSFRDKDLTAKELMSVFPDISISASEDVSRGGRFLHREELADHNRLLRVMHARRVDGTLDFRSPDPALEEIREIYPESEELVLAWLRTNYPVDEDGAILARFRREEAPRQQENPSSLMQRGQKLGLYKTQDQSQKEDPEYYGPQSGRFYAKLNEDKDDDVFGRSELERIRTANEKEAEEEEKQMQERIDRSMAEAEAKAEVERQTKKANGQALEARPDAKTGLEVSEGTGVRPPNEFEKWVIRAQERASSNLTLESPEIANMSTTQRLLPTFLFVVAGCIAMYLYTQNWEPPRRSERLFPNTSMSYATCGGIFAANLLVFALWKFPPAWKLLNKYFLVSAAYPYAASSLFNTFSHIPLKHLAWNMIGLFIFGPTLHEEVGRANFLAIYITTGLVGSLFSLSQLTLRGILYVTGTGASGSIYGITAAYLWLHKDDRFSFIFVPKDYQGDIVTKGWMLLALVAVWDLYKGFRVATIDTTAHMTGMAVGAIMAQLWKSEHGEVKQHARLGFLGGILGGKSSE